ncbi:MAG: hypothetical protein NW220_22975 [Leptolyngbyaceae cyanobacterium bins.349]|nr:hypothetical protein [Leptolyngbyaceae cyanobacterium bins.349]
MLTRQVITPIEPIAPALLQQADAAIADFAASVTPGVWTLLNKSTLVKEMRDRVRNPYLIGQGGQPFCGPASVVFELVRKQPLRYIEICSYLYLLGGFHSLSEYIPSSDDLRRATHGNLQMGQVDWMILSTFRDMENSLFPVEPNAPDLIRNLAGMTKSWEMCGWIREILGYKTAECTYAFLHNDLQALKKANAVIQQGGVAFALVTAEGMLTDKPPLIPLPTHWIGLVGNIAIQPDTIGFDIYTWSRKMRLQMDHVSFKKYFWAVVTGLP